MRFQYTAGTWADFNLPVHQNRKQDSPADARVTRDSAVIPRWPSAAIALRVSAFLVSYVHFNVSCRPITQFVGTECACSFRPIYILADSLSLDNSNWLSQNSENAVATPTNGVTLNGCENRHTLLFDQSNGPASHPLYASRHFCSSRCHGWYNQLIVELCA